MHDERRLMRRMYLRYAAVGVMCLLATLCAGRAHADEQRVRAQATPRAMLLAVGGPPGSAAPLNAVIHAELEALHVVTIVAAPGMDLAAVQLALDCVAQTPHCLKAVAAQERAQVLISPSLQRLPDGLMLSVLRFDTRRGELRRVLRRQSGANVGAELLDSVPDMLRELFDLPIAQPARPALAKAEAPAPAPRPVTAPAELRESRGVAAGPLVLAGAGAVSLAAGFGIGAVMQDSQKDYDRIRSSLDTKSDAQAALDARSRGKTQAAFANVLFAVGGGAIASGLVWLALDLSSKPDKKTSTLSLSPVLSPSHLGVMLTKRGVGL